MISKKPEHPFESSAKRFARPSADGRATYDDKLAYILEAASGVMAREGYQRASMRAIAGAAGISLAGLYHYVDSKEKLLFLIQFRAFNSLLLNLREKLHGVDDPAEQFRVTVRNHVHYFAANMEALRVCSHELDSLTGTAYKETLRLRRQYYQMTRSIVDRVFESLAPQSDMDRHVATMSLFGTLNWMYRWYDPRRDRAPTSLANQIVDQFLGGVTGVAMVKEQ